LKGELIGSQRQVHTLIQRFQIEPCLHARQMPEYPGKLLGSGARRPCVSMASDSTSAEGRREGFTAEPKVSANLI
jgi:hypothetical protein